MVFRLASNVSLFCIFNMLFACWVAVVVLPHHLGPSIKTAPNASKYSDNCVSNTRFKYAIINVFLKSAAKVRKNINPANCFLFLWHFVSYFCGVLLPVFVAHTICSPALLFHLFTHLNFYCPIKLLKAKNNG